MNVIFKKTDVLKSKIWFIIPITCVIIPITCVINLKENSIICYM